MILFKIKITVASSQIEYEAAFNSADEAMRDALTKAAWGKCKIKIEPVGHLAPNNEGCSIVQSIKKLFRRPTRNKPVG